MSWLVVKYLVTAAIVVLISELAKRSDKLGGLFAALPLVTIMAMTWMYLDKQSEEKIANHAWFTFWYVLPTLPMFLAFPFLLPKLGFALTLGASALISLLCFGLLSLALHHFGIELL